MTTVGRGTHISARIFQEMGIEEVAEIIGKIADGFNDACLQCLVDNKGVMLQAIKEQLYSGLDGEEHHLSPTYDDDPYFEEKGYWFHRSKDYKAWKRNITPPASGTMLGLAPRPDNIPNLFIDGTFYGSIIAFRNGDMLQVFAAGKNGPDIVNKYGDTILDAGPTAIEHFNKKYLSPAIDKFFKDCGYR